MKDGIYTIEEILKAVEKPSLSVDRKDFIKANILKQAYVKGADPEFSLVYYVKDAAMKVYLSAVKKASIKERVMNYAGSSHQKGYFFTSFFWGFAKKAISVGLSLIMTVGVFGFMTLNVRIAMAGSFTYVDDLRGEVSIERAGEDVLAYGEMRLQEGDIVKTGVDGWVSIKFLDDSVARLKSDTELKINRLFESTVNSAVTNVELEVKEGDVWSRVLNLFEGDASFSVNAGDIHASARKAAFNVHKSESEAVVEVYSNVVNVNKKNLKSGQKIVAATVAVDVEPAPQVVEISSNVSDEWVQTNLQSDVEHITEVADAKTDSLKVAAGLLPESALYSVKSLKGDVMKLLTFDDISSSKIDFEVAERKFVEWTLMMKDGKATSEQVKEVYDSFVAASEQFKNVISGVRASGDDKYADELKVYIQSEIGAMKKEIVSILPDDALYVAKESVLAAEIAAAETDAEVALIKQNQAVLKLAEAQDLAEAGQSALATEAVKDFVQTSKQVKEGVDALSVSEKETVESQIAGVVEESKDMLSTVSEDITVAADVVTDVVTSPDASVSSGVSISTVQQTTSEYGVPVSGSGADQKPLDPLLDLNR